MGGCSSTSGPDEPTLEPGRAPLTLAEAVTAVRAALREQRAARTTAAAAHRAYKAATQAEQTAEEHRRFALAELQRAMACDDDAEAT